MSSEPSAVVSTNEEPFVGNGNIEVKKEEPEVNKLFRMVMKYQGSDLHLKVGLPPMMHFMA